MAKQWTQTGFWVLLGLSLGMLLNDLARPTRLDASASNTAGEGTTLLATGASNNPSIELVWLLNDKGFLSCLVIDPRGQVIATPLIDMKKELDVRGGKKPKFAMVTGKFAVGVQQGDALYITETSSNRIIGIAPGPGPQLKVLFNQKMQAAPAQ